MNAKPIPEPADLSATKHESDCAEEKRAEGNFRDPQTSTPENTSVGNKSETFARDKGKNEKAPGKKPSGKSPKARRIISVTKEQAYKHAEMIASNMRLREGKFLKDEKGRFYVQLDGKTIPLNETSESNNIALDELLSTRYLPGTSSPAGRYTVRWLRILAARKTKDASILRRFSALSKDERRLYVPVKGALLQVSASGIKSGIKDGENVDQIVLEAADGQELFDFVNADPKEGLKLFEELVVNVQAVVEPAMAWLEAMQSVLFPFLRTAYQDRFIAVNLGGSQSGKTSGARWFSTLLGFDDVRGDYTPAAIRAAGDIGVFFLDNKEERNLSRELEDLLLFMATGGESARSNPSGGLRKNRARPVMSLTSIEGPHTAELKNRCVSVLFGLAKEEMKAFSPKKHLEGIRAERNKIMSALMFVLKRFLQMQTEISSNPDPVPDGAARFQDNYRAVCNLLRAFAQVAGKPADWSEGMIAAWSGQLSTVELVNDRLDYLVRRFIEEKVAARDEAAADDDPLLTAPVLREARVPYKGTPGTLYITNYAAMIDWGEQHDPLSFPRTSQALSSRLKEIDCPSFRVIRESDARGDRTLEELLKHKETLRFVGFFVPDDAAGN